jgi:hypothetical protein
VSTHESLKTLSRAGYIHLGTGEDGKRYGKVAGFDKHQRVNRPTPSKIKQLSIDWEDAANPHGGFSEDSPPEGNREQGKEEEPSLRSGSCAELHDSSTPTDDLASISPADGDHDAEAEAEGEVFLQLPTNGGGQWPVMERYVTEQEQRFPAVDVRQAIRQMQAWLDANPRKRKTRTGMKAFITNWLGREQNRGGNVRPMPSRGHLRRSGFGETDYDGAAREMGFNTDV